VIDLRLGRWQDVLRDVECDALICDPPYGERVHAGQKHGRVNKSANNLSSRGIEYKPWGETEIVELVESWSPRTRGWFCVFSDSEIYPLWRDALRAAGRYVFAPLACVQRAQNVRLAGDGPANWSTWLVVARPRKGFGKWGSMQGAYIGGRGAEAITAGAKPLWLMQAIILDYSSPGDLICDPCAGGATTLMAAATLGRQAIGAEMDPNTCRKARQRLLASTLLSA